MLWFRFRYALHVNEESFPLKRTLWIVVLAAGAAAFVPLAAGAQVPEAAPPVAPSYKYSVYGGFAYTSLNQLNLSRHGLLGGKVTVTRDWGKYFALMASGDYYKPSAGSLPANPGDPSVYSFLAGPEVHANIYGPVDALFFVELGLEHTGGEQMNPSTSFAGGFGGGALYHLNSRWAIEVTGDRVGASFSLANNSSQLGYSSHRTWDPRATIGAVFRF